MTEKKIISSGSTLIDLILGGGYESGTIVNLIAESGAGKSYLAAEMIGTSYIKYKKDFAWRYLDKENGFKFNTKKLYGVDIIDNTKAIPGTVEEMACDFAIELEALKKVKFFIYVADSYDALSSNAEKQRDRERNKAYVKGNDLETPTYAMEKAKFSSEFFRLRTSDIEDKNCLFVIISQKRSKVGATFGRKWKRSGGDALDYYCGSILELTRCEDLKKTVQGETRSYGYVLKARALKSRNEHPYRECYINILYTYGLDDISSNIDYLYSFKTEGGKTRPITKQKIPKSDWIEKDTGEFSKAEFISFIEEKGLEEELAKRVKEKWDMIDEAIIPVRKRKF